jgi:outer membrane protein TolC
MKISFLSFMAVTFFVVGALSEESGKADPAPNTAPALSFSEAYERMLDRNLDVQSQQLNVEIYNAKKLARVGAFTPQINLVANETQQTTSDIYPFQAQPSAAITGSANLFRSGTDFAALRGASNDIEASRENLQNEKLKAEDDAVLTLIEFIKRTRESELISQIVKLKEESVKIARERYSRGLLAQQEVDKTQIDLDNSQARLVDANVALAAARANVSSRLGAFQNVNLDWPWKGLIISGSRPEGLEFKLENRPDFRASLQTLEAEGWRRHAARAFLLPSLDLTASYGSADLSDRGRHDWSAALILKIPLFEQFAGYSAARLQTLVKNQAEIAREVVTRNAGIEVESYRRGFSEARESAVAREKTSKLTQRLFTDNLQRFRLGRASANELTFDQNRLLEAQILEVEGWAGAHLSFVRLCHALGHRVTPAGVCQSTRI